MVYTCVVVRNYVLVVVYNVIIYFIIEIVMENKFVVFSNIKLVRKTSIRQISKLKSVPDFKVV